MKSLLKNVTIHHVHDDVIKWKHFPRYWPCVWGIHRSPVNSPHKGQWRGALMFSLICARINGWVNNGEAGDLRHNRPHYDVIVMATIILLVHVPIIYIPILFRYICELEIFLFYGISREAISLLLFRSFDWPLFCLTVTVMVWILLDIW